jgi:2-polyprenyl-3-methyl-5-hydroxy-6-metoxy-1,4-benzoquinol methylase
MQQSERANLELVSLCPVCGSESQFPFLSVNEWTLVRCGSCAQVFTSPRLTSEALMTHYAAGYYEGASVYFENQSLPPTLDQVSVARLIRKMIALNVPKSLDIGTGAGSMVEAFADAGFDAAGTEPSKAARSLAEKMGRNVTDADLGSFAANSFDCVTMMHVLEHISDPMPFLRDACRIVRPGGFAVVEVPNIGSRAAIAAGAAWRHLYPDTHLLHFTPRSLANALRQAGFNIRKVYRVGGEGLFAGHTSTTKTCIPTDNQPKAIERKRMTLRQALWQWRQPILRMPGVRALARWVNWELLGHGEFVRIVAQKPKTNWT